MTADHTDSLGTVLKRLRSGVSGRKGALLAAVDGFAWVHDLHPDHEDDADSAAAMVASMLGLGQRLIRLIGPAALSETTIRSEMGYVCIYAVGDNAVLTVLTDESVNLARLHLDARDAADELDEILVDRALLSQATVAHDFELPPHRP